MTILKFDELQKFRQFKSAVNNTHSTIIDHENFESVILIRQSALMRL